ncbi:MAG: AEC family transporter [Pseudomonadota bacterium]
MPDVLGITTPIFLLIGLGFVAVRTGLFAKAALPALGSFVITFCIPALLFKSLSQRSIAEVANAGYLLAYAAGSLLTLAVGLLWARSRHQPRDAAAMTAMGMACANTAFIGYPIALQVVGPEATVALALTMLVENFLMIPLCLALADSASARHVPLALAFGRALLGLRRNPIVLGILGGLAMALLGWHLPAPVQRAVELLSLASAAASLFFIGGSLVGLQVGALVGQVTAVAAGKLLLHPLAVLLALHAVVALSGPVSAPLQWSAVLMAAAPMLGIYPILGQRYGRQAVNAASMLVTTVASFATLALVIWLLHAAWNVHLPP